MILQLVNWTTKSPSKLEGLLAFALTLAILNLDKPLKLKDSPLHSKREKFCSLLLILQTIK
jgi:hypothetical protein